MQGLPVFGGPHSGELYYPVDGWTPAPGTNVSFPGAPIPGGEYFVSEDGASVVWFADEDSEDLDATPIVTGDDPDEHDLPEPTGGTS